MGGAAGTERWIPEHGDAVGGVAAEFPEVPHGGGGGGGRSGEWPAVSDQTGLQALVGIACCSYGPSGAQIRRQAGRNY